MANVQRKSRDWFRNDESGSRSVPVQRGQMPAHAMPYLRPVSNFVSDMNQMFENALRSFELPLLAGAGAWGMQDMFRPKVDIAVSDGEYDITVEVPGLDEKDLRLDVSPDGTLTISGEKRLESENKDKEKDYACMECAYGAFERTLSLPEDVDQEAIEARFKNGVLTIACPRTETGRAQRRQIPVNAGGSGRSQGAGANTNESGSRASGSAGGAAAGSKRAA